jgi:histidyl-tRNA synthetase
LRECPIYDSYDEQPTRTEAVLIPEGTLSVTRWLGARLTPDNMDSVLPKKIYYDVRCLRNELTSTLSNTKARQFTQFGIEVLGTATREPKSSRSR